MGKIGYCCKLVLLLLQNLFTKTNILVNIKFFWLTHTLPNYLITLSDFLIITNKFRNKNQKTCKYNQIDFIYFY